MNKKNHSKSHKKKKRKSKKYGEHLIVFSHREKGEIIFSPRHLAELKGNKKKHGRERKRVFNLTK